MVIKKIKLIKYNDPQHGWLRVKRNDINILGIADKITQYSYQRGKWVYLEEDQDIGAFIEALALYNGCKIATTDSYQIIVRLLLDIKYKHNNGSSRIRGYEHYRYDKENDLNF